MNISVRWIAALAALALLAGCASPRSGQVYSRDDALREQVVRYGVVDTVREVTIEGTRSGIGAAAGAAVGGIGGSAVGHGQGSAAAAVVGAVVGGIAGQALEEASTQRRGLEITIRMDSGQTIAVVQETDEQFRPGDRVRVISGGGQSRVSH